MRPDQLGKRPRGVTGDGHAMTPGGRVFVRAVLVDPQRRASVIGPLDVITPAWIGGAPTSLWRVRLADGRIAVVDPSMVTLRPIPAHLDLLRRQHAAMVRRHWVGEP